MSTNLLLGAESSGVLLHIKTVDNVYFTKLKQRILDIFSVMKCLLKSLIYST